MFQSHQILRRLKLNFGAHAFGYVVSILNQVCLLPVFLLYWPKAVYGEWLVLSAVPVYIALSDFGLEAIGGNRLSMAAAKGDYSKVNLYLSTFVCFQSAVLAFILLLAAALAHWGDLARWLSVEQISRHELNVALVLLAARAVLACQLGIFRSIYRANLLAARGVFISNFSRFADFVMIIVALAWWKCGVIGVAVTMLAVQVVTLGAAYLDALWTCPQFHFGVRHFSFPVLRESLRESATYQLIPASSTIVLQGMTLMVNYTLGPLAVVTYNAVRAVCRASFIGVQMIGWAASSELPVLYGRNDLARMAGIFRGQMQVSLWFSVLVAAGVLGFGDFAVSLLTHGKVHALLPLLGIFALGIVATAFWNSADIALITTNRHAGFARLFFFYSLLLIPLSVVLMRWWGISGAPLATLILDLCLAPYVWKYARAIFPPPNEITFAQVTRLPSFSKLWNFAFGKKQIEVAMPGPNPDVPLPLVSIVITNFNYARYVKEAVESALNQTYKNIEVILIDDGSTDDSRSIIESFCAGNIRALFQENRGQGGAINRGVEAARGEIIVMLDADDKLLPHAVERIVAARREGVVFYPFRLRVEDLEGRTLGFEPPLNEPEISGRCDHVLLRRGCYLRLPNGKAFETAALRKIMPIPEADFHTAADTYLQDCIVFHGEVQLIEEPLAVWRQHGGNDHLRWRVEFDYDSLRDIWQRDANRQKALLAQGAKWGVEIPPDVIYRHPYQLRARVLLWKLYPQSEPGRRERFSPLVKLSFQSTWIYSHVPLLFRLKQTLWFLIVFAVPATVLPGLFEWIRGIKRCAPGTEESWK